MAGIDPRFRQDVRRPDAQRDRFSDREQAMTWIYFLGAIVALALLVYLLCALLKPEWFQ
jgi:K+-transporting ATPase KdpF subunit